MILIAGVDEAGRGPLAGPVVAAAVILDEANPINGLADSKKLSASKRERLFAEICLKAKAFYIAEASVAEIDALNILQASLLAMHRAVEGLIHRPDQVLIDGTFCPPQLTLPCQAIVRGDSLIPAISAASILAKVHRDRLMTAWETEYPGYGFAKHAGYGTKMHMEALKTLGVTTLHRRSYAPIKALLS